MFKKNFYKIVVFVPEKNADSVREAMGQAGAGQIGNYKYCSFQAKGLVDLYLKMAQSPPLVKLEPWNL